MRADHYQITYKYDADGQLEKSTIESSDTSWETEYIRDPATGVLQGARVRDSNGTEVMFIRWSRVDGRLDRKGLSYAGNNREQQGEIQITYGSTGRVERLAVRGIPTDLPLIMPGCDPVADSADFARTLAEA